MKRLPLFLFLVIALLVIWVGTDYQSTKKMVTFTVNDKGIKPAGEGKSVYMIYTSEGVFKNEDELTQGKFNSSDLYNQLKVDSTYRCKVIGYREPVLSMYLNILSVVRVNKP